MELGDGGSAMRVGDYQTLKALSDNPKPHHPHLRQRRQCLLLLNLFKLVAGCSGA